MKTYTGIVKLSYRNERGYPDGIYVMAFHNTANELKKYFVPNTGPQNIKITYEKR